MAPVHMHCDAGPEVRLPPGTVARGCRGSAGSGRGWRNPAVQEGVTAELYRSFYRYSGAAPAVREGPTRAGANLKHRRTSWRSDGLIGVKRGGNQFESTTLHIAAVQAHHGCSGAPATYLLLAHPILPGIEASCVLWAGWAGFGIQVAVPQYLVPMMQLFFPHHQL
jgi:hypothetical protein